jgi:hypothetical protein
MNLLFKIRDGIHEFKVEGPVESGDEDTLSRSLHRFFESSPEFTVLDCSSLDEAGKARIKTVVETAAILASSRGFHFISAMNPEENERAGKKILELALERKIKSLEAKIEIREKMRIEAEKLLEENLKLRSSMKDELKKLDGLSRTNPWVGSLARKLWTEERE